MLTGFRRASTDRTAITEAEDVSEASPGESRIMPATLIVVALTSLITGLWLFGAWQALVPAEGLAALTPSETAAVLAALAAPPAVLWLGLAVGASAVSARRSERALRAVLFHTRRATEQAEVQVRTLLQMQEDTRRRRMLEGLDEALADMRGSLAVVAERTGLLSAEETELTWARTAAGDRWAFANAFLTPWAYQQDLPEILGERVAQAPEAAVALQTYLRRWRRLLAVLKENEADKLLRETLEDGPADRLLAFLLRVETTAVGLMSGGDGDAPPPAEAMPAAPAAAAAPHSAARAPYADGFGTVEDLPPGSAMAPTDFGEEPGGEVDLDLLPEPRRRGRKDRPASEMPLFGAMAEGPAAADPRAGAGAAG